MDKFDPYLISEIAAWKREDGSQTPLSTFVSIHVRAVEAIAFAGVLWPRFVVVRGCTLLEEHYCADTFDDWWTSLKGNTHAIEAVINHVHLWDAFDLDVEESLDEVINEGLTALGELMAFCWRGALANAVPGKRFEFDVYEDNGGGPTITFWTVLDEKDNEAGKS